jgi:cobalt/nickel transport system ATP-binding protein
MEDIVRLENITYNYLQKHNALQNVNISVKQGDVFSIIGSNGSGKSTLLHIISGLLFPSSGKIYYKNDVISEDTLKNSSFNASFRSSLGYVFQNSDSQLFCPTVFDELIFGPLQAGYDKEKAFSRAHDIMHMMRIEHIKDRPTYMLSGGEKKRVAIGAVLTTNPDVLLLDEPMSGLDPKTRSFLIQLLFELNQSGKTIIIATHHLELVDHFQSRVAVLSENHEIEKIGTTDEILSDTELLIKTNLISEYPHRHGDKMHKHLSTGFLFHKHKHE